MANKRGLLTFVNLSILLLTGFVGVVGDIVEKPLNTAISVGNQTAFNCSSNINAGSIGWTYTTDCNTAIGDSLTVSNCDLNSSYAHHYRTEKPDGSHCNLFVFDALLSLGGCYICSDGFSATRLANAFLVIVDSSASIATNSTDLMSGEDVMISCNVSYRGSSIQPPPISPSFYWTMASDPSQNIPSNPGSTTNTSASSYIIVTAQPPNVPSYLCNLFFDPPNYVPPGGASNAPVYSQSWTTAAYPVLYPPQNAAISGIPSPCLHQFVELTCSASGYPTPTYNWLNLTSGDILTEGNILKIDRGGSYQCVASNTIRSVTYQTTITANVSECECQSNCPATDETAIIVVSVLFAISLVINTGLLTWIFCWRIPKERVAAGSMSRGPDDDSSRQAAYKSSTKPETLAYETLEHAAAAAAYQELTLEQKLDNHA